MKKRCEIADGNEIRGMLIRVYPTAEQAAKLDALEAEQRRVWNWLVPLRVATHGARADIRDRTRSTRTIAAASVATHGARRDLAALEQAAE